MRVEIDRAAADGQDIERVRTHVTPGRRRA
jgi:hypothetical protein